LPIPGGYGCEIQKEARPGTKDDREPLRGVAWAAKRLGLGESAVRRLVHRDGIPYLRLGHRILFRATSLDRFIESREIGGDIQPRRGRRRRL